MVQIAKGRGDFADVAATVGAELGAMQLSRVMQKSGHEVVALVAVVLAASAVVPAVPAAAC